MKGKGKDGDVAFGKIALGDIAVGASHGVEVSVCYDLRYLRCRCILCLIAFLTCSKDAVSAINCRSRKLDSCFLSNQQNNGNKTTAF